MNARVVLRSVVHDAVVQKGPVLVGLAVEPAAAAPAAHQVHQAVDGAVFGVHGRGQGASPAAKSARSQTYTDACGADLEHPLAGAPRWTRPPAPGRRRPPGRPRRPPRRRWWPRRSARCDRRRRPQGLPAVASGSQASAGDAHGRLDDRLHLLVERLVEHRQRELVVQHRVGVAPSAARRHVQRQPARPRRRRVRRQRAGASIS